LVDLTALGELELEFLEANLPPSAFYNNITSFSWIGLHTESLATRTSQKPSSMLTNGVLLLPITLVVMMRGPYDPRKIAVNYILRTSITICGGSSAML